MNQMKWNILLLAECLAKLLIAVAFLPSEMEVAVYRLYLVA